MSYFLVKDGNYYHRKLAKGGSIREVMKELEQEKEFNINEIVEIEFLCEDKKEPEMEIREIIRSLFREIENLATTGWDAIENNGDSGELETLAKVISEKGKKAVDIARALGNFSHAGFSKVLT